MNELKNRGVQDILMAVVDGLKGFPEAITATFPQTVVQTCVVHLIRHSLNFGSWKGRKPLMPALRAIYQASSAEDALKAIRCAHFSIRTYLPDEADFLYRIFSFKVEVST